MNRLTICKHPLVQDKLAKLRDKSTPPDRFRILMEEAATLLGVYALEHLRTKPGVVATPNQSAAVRIPDQPVVLVAVLRAGLGMVPGLLRIAPEASIGHIGLYRDEETLKPVRYYVRLPKALNRSLTILLDPMLATGGSSVEALKILKTEGASQIILISLLSSKPGVRRVQKEHPDVRIVTAAVDPKLNQKGYIVPGLGDAGDRLFGTLG